MIGPYVRRLFRKPSEWCGDRRFHVVLVRAFFALAIFGIDPLGVSVQESRAVDNSLAWLNGNVWPYKPSNKVAVLLIDEDDLKSFELDWPIPYSKTASIIRLLACAQAAGVFFDFTASEQFNLAEGSEELKAVLSDWSKVPRCNDGQKPNPIEVFFGEIDRKNDYNKSITSGMSDDLAGRHRTFWIGSAPDERIYWPGRMEFPPEPISDASDQSPAFGIARRFCKLPHGDVELCPRPDLEKAQVPLRLFWSAEVSDDQNEFLPARPGSDCREPLTFSHGLAVFLRLSSMGRYQTCPPVLTLVARQLYAEDPGNPPPFLKGRFVFVGANLAGLNDAIQSPVHGYLPGVYYHAVALDNLWHFGVDYPTKPEPYVPLIIAIGVYLAIEMASEFSSEKSRYPDLLKTSVIIGSAGLVCFIVYLSNWPYSLLVGIFGYYFSVSAITKLVAKFLNEPDR
jgi:hypothetical protein